MNWLLLAVIIALLLFGFYGSRKGAIRIVFSLVEVVVLIILFGVLTTNVLAFLGLFLVALIVLHFIGKALKLFAHLPVIRGIDRTIGFFVGLLLGLLFIWLFFWIMTLFSGTMFGGWVFAMIGQSNVLTWLYRHNGVISFASAHFTWYNS